MYRVLRTLALYTVGRFPLTSPKNCPEYCRLGVMPLASQWERLLKNQGAWVGSFTQMSSAGEIQDDTPTEVTLVAQDGGNNMRQEIRKWPSGQPTQETVLEYRSLGRGVLFCEDGAFSQGSIQWSPVSEFGAELGLIHGHERLRLALVFPRQASLGSLTLIREHLKDARPSLRSPLSVDQLLGTWIGQATTVYPDYQPETVVSSRLVLMAPAPDTLTQTLSLAPGPTLESQGQRVGGMIQFSQGRQPVTVLLLPSGASVTFPAAIVPGYPFFLELGWLITPTLRQRLIRSYDERGSWVGLTQVVEEKVAAVG